MKVEVGSKFEDERGVIQNIVGKDIEHVALITSKKGSVRSNHYHLNGGGHYLYILSGKIQYSERNLDGSEKIVEIYGAGEMVFTGSMKVHRVDFLEDSVLLSLDVKDRGPEQDAENTVKEIF